MGDLLNEGSRRVETLLDRFSAFPASTGARSDAEELVRVVSGLYGECLRRLAAGVRERFGTRGDELLVHCCQDPLVASLLITHGLHPVPLEQRVRDALDAVRPALREKGADVELVRVDEDVASVRVDGSVDVVPLVERAIHSAAPEVLEIRAAGQTISLLGAR